MKKIFTFFYTIDDFQKMPENIFDVNSLYSDKNEDFKEVFDALNKFERTPKKETIDKILNFSKSFV